MSNNAYLTYTAMDLYYKDSTVNIQYNAYLISIYAGIAIQSQVDRSRISYNISKILKTGQLKI